MIIEMMIGLGLTVGLVKVAQNKTNVYIIDKSSIKWWVERHLKKDVSDLNCSVCKAILDYSSISRIIKKNDKLYFICKKKECRVEGL